MNIQQDISWELALRVWWHFFWRYTVYGLLVCIPVAIVIGLLGGLANIPLLKVIDLAKGIAVIFIFFTNIWVVKKILTKQNKISKYRLVLIED